LEANFAISGIGMSISYLIQSCISAKLPYTRKAEHDLSIFSAIEVSMFHYDIEADSDEGLFGQFRDNSFVKVGIKYTF
jgi:hypothetical protein